MRQFIAVLATVALLISTGLLTHDSRSLRTWSLLLERGCKEAVFGFAGSQVPRFIAEAASPQAASNMHSQTVDTIRRAVYSFSHTARPDFPVNLNCDIGPFVESGLNVYVVSRDDPQFAFARGNAITIAAPVNAIILGYGYQDLFGGAWETAAIRAGRLKLARSMASEVNREALEAMIVASAEFSFESYLIYVEWMVAHEMGHLYYNHSRPSVFTSESKRLAQEQEADRFGARALFASYSMIRAHLQGLLYDAMLENFSRASGRDWTIEDGVPFTLEGGGSAGVKVSAPKWPLCVPGRIGHYDHFLVRTLDMLEALSLVRQEDIVAVSEVERQLNREGSSLRLLHDSSWQHSVAQLVLNIRSRLIVMPRASQEFDWSRCRIEYST